MDCEARIGLISEKLREQLQSAKSLAGSAKQRDELKEPDFRYVKENRNNVHNTGARRRLRTPARPEEGGVFAENRAHSLALFSQRAPAASSFVLSSPRECKAAVSSPPPMNLPPTNTRGTERAGVI